LRGKPPRGRPPTRRATATTTSRRTRAPLASSTRTPGRLEGPGTPGPSRSAQQFLERRQQLEPRGARLLRRRLELGRDPGQRSELAVARECRLRAARALQQVERDRRLVREQREQVHLGEREALLARPVEPPQHAA